MGRIQQTRYDELLRRTTAQYGGGSKVGEALEDLFPTIDVENVPIELLRATKWVMGQASAVQTPTAGNRAGIALFNPVGSGQLLVLTSAWIRLGANGVFNCGPIFAALPTASVAGAERDTRAGQIESTVGLMQTSANVTQSAFLRINGLSTESYPLSDSNGLAVLSPGTGWQISADTVDVSLSIAFMWRERVAQPEELNF